MGRNADGDQLKVQAHPDDSVGGGEKDAWLGDRERDRRSDVFDRG